MQIVRPAFAPHPSSFGRLRREQAAGALADQSATDLRTFAMTFVAGFLFFSIFIG